MPSKTNRSCECCVDAVCRGVREQLFRRSIGRSAARATQALDLVHRRRHRVLQDLPWIGGVAGKGRHTGASENDTRTSLLPDDHEILRQGRAAPAVRDVPIQEFRPYNGIHDKAKGSFPITHGDMARAFGYCESIGLYQRPAARWRKTYEDRAFRWLWHERHRHSRCLPDPPCRQGAVPAGVGHGTAPFFHTHEPGPAILMSLVTGDPSTSLRTPGRTERALPRLVPQPFVLSRRSRRRHFQRWRMIGAIPVPDVLRRRQFGRVAGPGDAAFSMM